MGDLTAHDVQEWTNNRLLDDGGNGGVTRMLTAALVVARRETGWHVSPVRTETLLFDNPRSRQLTPPTQRIVSINDINDNGTIVDPSGVTWSKGDSNRPRRVSVRKRNGGFWVGGYDTELDLTHGFTEDEAADWREAILSMVDQMSTMPIDESLEMSPFNLQTKTVDDVSYRWAVSAAESAVFSIPGVISKYSLPDLEFM